MALPNFKDRRKISKLFIRGSNSLFIVLLAITVGSLFIIVTGKNPLEFLVLSFKGAFGNLYAVSNFIAKMIPLTFTGLAVAIAFRHHLFNIGMEGQLYLGALAATWMGITFGNLPAAFIRHIWRGLTDSICANSLAPTSIRDSFLISVFIFRLL